MISNRRKVALEGPDFYPTPAWATHALMLNEKFHGRVWEPACGNGFMARVIKKYNQVCSTDLYDHGYGKPGVDFLHQNSKVDNIITNPPFNIVEDFFFKSLTLARYKFAFLLRTAFLEGQKRSQTIFRYFPPSRIWIFPNRVTMYPCPSGITDYNEYMSILKSNSGGTTSYAWFVWEKPLKPHKTKRFSAEVCWFDTHYKDHYNHI